jgi:hypothetical protein
MITKPQKVADIQAAPAEGLSWDGSDVRGSLDRVFKYVVHEASKSESWYWQNKKTKALWSRIIQWTAISLTGLGALLPIIIKLDFFPGFAIELRELGVIAQHAIDSGLLTSLCIGVAGALVGFDRFSGLSSGWARYVLTGTTMRSAIEEFRMDWTALLAQLDSLPPPGPPAVAGAAATSTASAAPAALELVSAMLQRAKVFRMAIEALVMKETQDWATEFQSNMAQMERDLKVQIDQAKADRAKVEQELKAQTERASAERERANQPGSVEATVSNAGDTDGFRFNAQLETNQVVVVDEAIANSQTWARLDLAAGQYKLTVRALIKNKPVAGMIVVSVKPGETTKAELMLPAPP